MQKTRSSPQPLQIVGYNRLLSRKYLYHDDASDYGEDNGNVLGHVSATGMIFVVINNVDNNNHDDHTV